MNNIVKVFKTDIGCFVFDEDLDEAWKNFMGAVMSKFFHKDFPFKYLEVGNGRGPVDKVLTEEDVPYGCKLEDILKHAVKHYRVPDLSKIKKYGCEPTLDNFSELAYDEDVPSDVYQTLCLLFILKDGKYDYENLPQQLYPLETFDYMRYFDFLTGIRQESGHKIYDIEQEVICAAARFLINDSPNIRVDENIQAIIDKCRASELWDDFKFDYKWYHPVDCFLSAMAHKEFIYIENDLEPEDRTILREVYLNGFDAKLKELNWFARACMIETGELVCVGPGAQIFFHNSELPVYRNRNDFKYRVNKDLPHYLLSDLLAFFKVYYQKSYLDYTCDTYIVQDSKGNILRLGKGLLDKGFKEFLDDLIFSMDKKPIPEDTNFSIYQVPIHHNSNMKYKIEQQDLAGVKNELKWSNALLRYRIEYRMLFRKKHNY
ncbi:MAG: hypothetical protein LIO77_05480 [Rikenellaceae bacterium]|nr:hypothetical protein [Rikenellaceae bacterium]